MQAALGMTGEEVGDDQRRQVVADGQRRTDLQLAVAGMAFKTLSMAAARSISSTACGNSACPSSFRRRALPKRSKSCVSYCRSSSPSAVLVADCDSDSSRRHAKRSRAEPPPQKPRSAAK
jgi:hypothetical protein